MINLYVSTNAARYDGIQSNILFNDPARAAWSAAYRYIRSLNWQITEISRKPAFGRPAFTIWIAPKEDAP